ncbi:YheC/YheD family endospore coat-associated protein [Bacillus sp. Marseille-P3661]|uniref:YheC/YheD family endospore coat-associated protein n=1 Tax=Bacillus sp. Marseille-P3661 TaxID=1936234 RepID=UPI000C850E83|nr:YheC/YheD family protein [Bacillus sp. Marseille-P3661]
MELYDLQEIFDVEETIYLPEPLFSSSRVFNNISFGTEICSCKIKVSKKLSTISISHDIWNSLKIPYRSKVHVIPNEDTLHIGPLVGIFTAGFTGSLLRPIGDRSLFFAKILAAEKKVGAYTFVFGANHINWEDGKINGYFHTNQGWQQIEVPFPNVVYDRLPNRKTENHVILQDIKKRLQTDYLIPWFNPGFFNKWEIHQLFSANDVKEFLPETVAHPSLNDLKELLNKYPSIYIKPINGSLGLGIYQIIRSKDSDDGYYCRFRTDEKNHLRKYNTIESLYHHLFRVDRLENYLAQQGVQLIRCDGKPIDFRIHTNKDDEGKWKMSAIAAKIAGTGSVTTHLKSGGIVKTIDEISKIVSLPVDILKQLENCVLSMSSVLEQQMNGTIGEIGFDIGIDKNNDIWLFEANSKPGRSIFKNPKLREYEQLSRSLPISFAVFLTKKAIYEPGVLFNEN